MVRPRRIKVVDKTATNKTAHKNSRDDASDVLPTVTFEPIPKRWISNDLQMLQSGLFADAEIICQGDATPRKVHRNILATRSAWFKKAFLGNFKVGRSSTSMVTIAAADTTKEAEECKVNLQETPWRVDLMLYFFHTGGIDVNDESLTGGHDLMNISIELVRLGDFYQSTDMSNYGSELLRGHLSGILSQICPTDANLQTTEAAFNEMTDFPQQFCNAVVNAFGKERPVKPAQNMLADFAIAARIHMFKNREFRSFITDKAVPEFGNLVLAALLAEPE